MSKRLGWAAVGLALAGFACNAIVGIEEPIERRADAGAGSGGIDGSAGSSGAGGSAGGGGGGTAGSDGGGGSGGIWWDGGDGGSVDDPPCDVGEALPASAVYVSADSGNDTSGDGSALAPLKTIGTAIGVARASSKTKVLLEVGVYAEAVVLENLPLGLTIDGAWERTGAASWTRVCSPGFKSLTLIQAPSAIAVTSESLTAPSGLTNLTVATKANGASPAAQSGETLIGILVRGDASAFSLKNVAVFTGRGGDGGDPGSATAGGTAACDGVTGCGATQGQDAPVAADGQPGDDATTTGTFSATGYVATDGTSGKTPGTAAQHGGKGGNGDCEPNAFLGCITDPPGTCINNVTQACASPGKCGCGGLGGAVGKPGRGAGASVALLIAGAGSIVNLEYAELVTSGGGDGSAGGLGGDGGPGTSGSKGADKVVNVGGTCAGEPFCTVCPPCQYNVSWGSNPGTNVTLIGGSPGGKGGTGGRGGPGGHGSGGPSYAIVKIGDAKAVLDQKSVSTPGPGGQPGGGSAAAGESAAEFTAP